MPTKNSAEERVKEQVTKNTLLLREVHLLEKNYVYWKNANALLACITHLDSRCSSGAVEGILSRL